MNRLSVGDTAPEFSLPDQTGKVFRLEELRRSQHVLLVFNLGFV